MGARWIFWAKMKLQMLTFKDLTQKKISTYLHGPWHCLLWGVLSSIISALMYMYTAGLSKIQTFDFRSDFEKVGFYGVSLDVF